MASSVTDICNLALGHLGEGQIASLDEDNLAARACELHYEATRDATLRSHRWNFAQGRVILSRLLAAPSFGWSYQYELPADCLRVLEVNDSEAGDVISDEFIVEGRKILTNAETVRLVYTKAIRDVSDFDALFVQAFALQLAIALTETIRGTTSKTEELTAKYERITAPLARRVDANEGRRRKGLLTFNSLALRERGVGCGSLGGGTGSSGATGGSSTFDPAAPGAIGGTTPAAGTFTTLTASTITATTFSGSGASLTGVVLTTGSYANPAWITSLAYSKITGAPSWQPLDADLTAISTLNTHVFGRSLLTLADAAEGRAALEIDAALADYQPLLSIDATSGTQILGRETTGTGAFEVLPTTGVQGSPVVLAYSPTFTGNIRLRDAVYVANHLLISSSLSSEADAVLFLSTTGSSTLTISGNADVSGTNTGDQTTITGNAGTATTLQTARTINGVSFNGSANITVPAAAETLTGSTLPALSGASLTALNASELTSGTVPAARGGAGTTSGMLKANGSGVVSAATAGTDYEAAQTLITQAIAEAGTSTATDKKWSVQRVWQAIAKAMASPAFCAMRDEFLGGQNSTGTVGELGWNFSASSAAFVSPAVGHPGIFSITTDGSGTALATLSLSGSAISKITEASLMAVGLDVQFVFQLTSTTSETLKVGMVNGTSTDAAPTRGVFLEYDTTSGDINFYAVCRDAGTSTRTSLGVAADTSWHRIRIFTAIANQISFSLDGAAAVTITTNVPNTAGSSYMPRFSIQEQSASARTLNADFFSLTFPASR